MKMFLECGTAEKMSEKYDVSIIIPVYNAERWLGECLQSIHDQEECQGIRVEVSVFLDSCTDSSRRILDEWTPSLEGRGFRVIVSKEDHGAPKGVGYAKNRAVLRSEGDFLCFQDADDVMLPRRIRAQLEMAARNRNAIVGCRFMRVPESSTTRFTRWANTLTPQQLRTQIFTSNGPTVIMPTWFCHRSVFDRVGGFPEGGKGIPEDLIFFFRHRRLQGDVVRSDEELLLYRYHPDAATFSIHENTIWELRVRELEERVLQGWGHFCIWNGGRQGRKLFRSLRPENRAKVTAFCDVDPKKVGSFYTHEESPDRPKPQVRIVHFAEATPPFVICVKMDMTGGAFERNLVSLNLTEGKDYYHFN